MDSGTLAQEIQNNAAGKGSAGTTNSWLANEIKANQANGGVAPPSYGQGAAISAAQQSLAKQLTPTWHPSVFDKVITAAHGVGAALAHPFIATAKQAGNLVHYFTAPPASHPDVIKIQQQLQGLDHQGKISASTKSALTKLGPSYYAGAAHQILTNPNNDSANLKYIQGLQQKQSADIRQAAGTVAAVASFGLGGTGVVKNAIAGALGAGGYSEAANPNQSGTELAKNTLEGGAAGAALSALPAVIKAGASRTPAPTQEGIQASTGALEHALGPNATVEDHINAGMRANGTSHEFIAPSPGPGAAASKPLPTDMLAPNATPKEANQFVRQQVSQAKSDVANTSYIQQQVNKPAMKFFTKQGENSNVANISNYERTGKFATEPAKGYTELYKNTMDAAHATLQKFYGEDHVGYVDNYVRRMFQFPTKADETKGTSTLYDMAKTLSANKSVTKSRTLNMPLDEALANMRSRGINVKMATHNPEELRQWAIVNAKKAEAYGNLWNNLKQHDLIQHVRVTGRPPEGYVKLDDRAATVYSPSDHGVMHSGTYYAPQDVAKSLNNSVSKGLEGSDIYKATRQINNSINQLQLGFSGFHLLGVSINAGVSDAALGMRQLTSGLAHGDIPRVATGAKHLVRSTAFPVSATANYLKGAAFWNGLKNNSPEAYDVLKKVFNPAGGRLGQDMKYENGAYKNLLAAWQNHSATGIAKAVGHSTYLIPQTIVESVAKPLFEHFVPNVKIGVFLNMAEDISHRMPNATSQELKQAYTKAWASVDNRFGQMVYDNLFWNKTVKDLAMVSTRSVGWNYGTIRELGSIKDIKNIAHGEVSDRLAYAAALPIYVGLMGAMYQYLHTGKGPTGLKDYYYPLNGLTKSNGTPDRTTLPTYMKDVYAYGTNPISTLVHKESPILNMASTLYGNKDYLGNAIRNPEDTTAKQTYEAGKYVLQNALPFSVSQSLASAGESGKSGAQQTSGFGERSVENLFGFTKAPGSITTPVAAQDFYRAYTPLQQQYATIKSQVNREIYNGNVNKAQQLADQWNAKVDPQFQGLYNKYGTNPDLKSYWSSQIGKLKISVKISKKGQAYIPK